MTRTSRPCALVNVKRSIFVPSGIAPNDDWVTAMTAMIIAPAMSEGDEIGDPDWFLLVDAVADGDAGQARHRAGARIGQPHVIRHVGLLEDQIAQPIVAAAVAGEQLRDRNRRARAEAFRQVDLVSGRGVPRLALVGTDIEPPFLAVEGDAVALVRHERVQRIAHRRAVAVADDRL